MKTMTCECGHIEQGSSENDVTSKMQSHIMNDHPDKSSSDHKKMLKEASKTMADVVTA